MERTFVLGPGVLITPSGVEYKVTSFTITQGDPIELKDSKGETFHVEPDRKIPMRIEFRNDKDED